MNYFHNERLEQNVPTDKYAFGTTSVDGNNRYLQEERGFSSSMDYV